MHSVGENSSRAQLPASSGSGAVPLSLAKTCEIGAVGRQVERGCADRMASCTPATLWEERLHDDDVARGRRDQGLLDPGKEACAVGPSKTRGDPVVTQGGNERGCLPVMGNGRHHPFAARSANAGPCSSAPRSRRERPASAISLAPRQVARAAATSGRSCSAAGPLF